VIEEQTAWREGLVDRREISGQMVDTDMLDHANAGRFVECAKWSEVAIVANLDPASVAETLRRDPLDGQCALLLAQRDADRRDAVLARRVHDERAPPAADVEQALARLEAELSANEVELGALRFVERVRRLGEVGARVNHAFVEEEFVEVVPDV